MGVAAELQDVFLNEADMLEDLPGRVRQAWWDDAAKVRGKIADDRIEVCMRIVPALEAGQVVSQRICGCHTDLDSRTRFPGLRPEGIRQHRIENGDDAV